ncbi:MAG: methyltransferase [candidate division WOR-3 bacterium]|nr:MAG: methyltransferase [candidate division WOR-3 bacterium]
MSKPTTELVLTKRQSRQETVDGRPETVDGRRKSVDGMQDGRFRSRVRDIWERLAAAEAAPHFTNVEGGSVEQVRDKRLRLHHCANYAAVLTMVDELGPGLRLLELGCGSGALSAAFGSLLPDGSSLTATDYSQDLVEHAQQFHAAEHTVFEQLDVRHAGSDRLAQADLVMLLEVIEHVSWSEAADLLRRLHAGLRPGARVIMTTLDRSPFPRPHSGYLPHVVEYNYADVNLFLSDTGSNPFSEFRLHRLVSSRIARESVRAENRGGYWSNRISAGFERMGQRSQVLDRLRRRVLRAGFLVYSVLPRGREFPLEEYLETMSLVHDSSDGLDADSFGIVAELRR